MTATKKPAKPSAKPSSTPQATAKTARSNKRAEVQRKGFSSDDYIRCLAATIAVDDAESHFWIPDNTFIIIGHLDNRHGALVRAFLTTSSGSVDETPDVTFSKPETIGEVNNETMLFISDDEVSAWRSKQ